MTRDELKTAIKETVLQIAEIIVKINHETDPALLAKLMFRKRELQYLQLCQIEQWDRLGEE